MESNFYKAFEVLGMGSLIITYSDHDTKTYFKAWACPVRFQSLPPEISIFCHKLLLLNGPLMQFAVWLLSEKQKVKDSSPFKQEVDYLNFLILNVQCQLYWVLTGIAAATSKALLPKY